MLCVEGEPPLLLCIEVIVICSQAVAAACGISAMPTFQVGRQIHQEAASAVQG